MSAAAAVLRSACRALRGPSSFEFPRASVVGESPMLREIITSRRLYSSSYHIVKQPPKLNEVVGGSNNVDHHAKLHNSAPPDDLERAAERMASKFDKIIAYLDSNKILLNQIEANIRENHRRKLEARGRRVLLGGVAIIVGIVMYVKKRRSKKINKATVDQEKSDVLVVD